MLRLLSALRDAAGGAAALPSLEVMQQRMFALNVAWEMDLANDAVIWDDDPHKDRILAATDRAAGSLPAEFAAHLGLAAAGYLFSMGRVAACYAEGRGTPKDPERALEWCRRGFEHGCTSDLLIYGKLLLERGDLEGAKTVFKNGAADGWAPAKLWLAFTQLLEDASPRSVRRVRTLLEEAQAKGSPAAEWLLAYNRAKGRFGLLEMPAGLRALLALYDAHAPHEEAAA